MRRLGGILVVVCVLACCGCGGGTRSDLVDMDGKITFGGGVWPTEGTLFFMRVEVSEGERNRPARADFDKEGNFRVGSYEKDDGIYPGKYIVSVECWKVKPSAAGPGVSYLPKKFQSAQTSGLTMDVPPGSGALQVEWDVPKN